MKNLLLLGFTLTSIFSYSQLPELASYFPESYLKRDLYTLNHNNTATFYGYNGPVKSVIVSYYQEGSGELVHLKYTTNFNEKGYVTLRALTYYSSKGKTHTANKHYYDAEDRVIKVEHYKNDSLKWTSTYSYNKPEATSYTTDSAGATIYKSVTTWTSNKTPNYTRYYVNGVKQNYTLFYFYNADKTLNYTKMDYYEPKQVPEFKYYTWTNNGKLVEFVKKNGKKTSTHKLTYSTNGYPITHFWILGDPDYGDYYLNDALKVTHIDGWKNWTKATHASGDAGSFSRNVKATASYEYYSSSSSSNSSPPSSSGNNSSNSNSNTPDASKTVLMWYKNGDKITTAKINNNAVHNIKTNLMPDGKTMVVYVPSTDDSYVIYNYNNKSNEEWHNTEITSSSNHFYAMVFNEGGQTMLRVIYKGNSITSTSDKLVSKLDNSILFPTSTYNTTLVFKGAYATSNLNKLISAIPMEACMYVYEKNYFNLFYKGEEITGKNRLTHCGPSNDYVIYDEVTETTFVAKNYDNYPVGAMEKIRVLCQGSDVLVWCKTTLDNYYMVYQGTPCNGCIVRGTANSNDKMATLPDGKSYIMQGASYSSIGDWKYSYPK